MGSEWTSRPLRDCATWYSGGTPHKGNSEYWNGSIPWISAKSLTEFFVGDSEDKVTASGAENGTRLVPKDTILFIVRGMSLKSEFRMGITTRPVTFNQDLKALVALDGVLPSFLAYAIKGRTQEVLGLVGEAGHGTGVLPTDRIQGLEILLPPPEEQRAIAHILGTLDDKIELNRKQNETLEAMARALFKAWFVDFLPVRAKMAARTQTGEPVRAKMEGRARQDGARSGQPGTPQASDLPRPCAEAGAGAQGWQRGQSLPGLPAHLYDLFPDRLVESELGEIPEGWRIGSLGEVAAHPRRSVQPDEIKGETPYIALEHMPKRCIALTEWGAANGLESNKYEFKQGEILFGKLRPYFHKVGVAPVDGVCSTDIVVIAPKLPIWFGFVLTHVSSDAFVKYTNAGSTGTKMPRTSWTEMARYPVVFPDENVVAAFNQHIQTASEKISAKIHESKSLAQLRDTLLPKLISGELRIKDAEAFLAERGL